MFGLCRFYEKELSWFSEVFEIMLSNHKCVDCDHIGEDEGEYHLVICGVCRGLVCEGDTADHALRECGWEDLGDELDD